MHLNLYKLSGGESEHESHEEQEQEKEEQAEITLPEAIKEVIRKANFSDGIVKGLHESAKVLDSGQAQVCFLQRIVKSRHMQN